MTALQEVAQPGYYGLPMLKKPLWRWEIALYFFAEGISSGCYMIAAAADIFGQGKYTRLIRTARIISFASIAPCAPLLIADLGRPERFHHMLRVFKPSSPMNLGAWALTGFGIPVTLLAVVRSPAAARAISILGLAPAFVMMSYPGVLLSTTSTPVWARTRLLGALLASSSMATAVAALTLASNFHRRNDRRSREALRGIGIAAHLCESAALAGYLMEARYAAAPLTRGSQKTKFWIGAVGCGLVLPWLVDRMQSKRASRTSIVASAALTLIGGLALKWAMVHAGQESAMDGDANRRMTAATADNPGFSPSHFDKRDAVAPESLDNRQSLG